MNSHYRWVIVAAGAFMGCVAIGAMVSLPVFLQPMSAATGWSRTAISLAMTLDFITVGIASFAWGMVMDRFGPRIVLLAGSSILGLGMALGPLAGGVIFDLYGTYGWLYVGSVLLVFAAAVIMLTFRPAPPREISSGSKLDPVAA